MLEKIRHHKSKLLYIIMFLPLLIIDFNSFNADTYWMIKYGQMIRQSGFFNKIPMTVHNFDYIPQQWFVDVIISILYDLGGLVFTLLYVYITAFICVLLFYKIIKLITNNTQNAQIFTFIFALPFCIMFSETRPQMISFICDLGLIYILERYIRDKDIINLLFMPFIFILQINSQATCWPFLVMICCAYILNLKYFKTNNIIDDSYNILNIIIVLIVSIPCLLINPYGIKMVTYIFKCFSSDIEYLSFEMQPLTIKNYGALVLILLFILFILLYKTKEQIKLHFLLLLTGSLICTFINIRSLVYFLIAFIIFVADYTKNTLDTEKLLTKIFGYYEIMMPSIIIAVVIIRLLTLNNFTLNNFCIRQIDYSTEGIVEHINQDSNKEHKRVYNYPFIGGYLQFNDLDVYMNSGLEPFLKSQNGKMDVIEEYLNLQFGRVNEKEFIDKYKFDYLILNNTDYLQEYAKNNLQFIYSNGDFDVYKCRAK